MDINEIKKILYKEKPKAHFSSMNKSFIRYYTKISETIITFLIPVSDIGDATFEDEMEAKLLIRWIYQKTEAEDGELVRKDL